MKNLFILMTAAIFTLSLNAKQVVFDFSDATAYGFLNPAAGNNTQVNSGDTLKQEGIVMVVTYASGNGFRFYSPMTTGVVNLRGYIGAKFDIIAPAGSKIYSAEISGTNANSQHISGDLKDGSWTNAAGADTLHSEVIKSTLQINTLTLIIAAEGETPELEKFDTLTVAQAKAICDTLADNASSTKKYYVEGYAINVQPYSTQYNNQIFFMVDDINAPDSLFVAYAAYPSKNDSVYPVLTGDKVRAFGTLRKYVRPAITQLELVNPTVEFITEVPGNRTIVIPIPDTITVAQAMEIGNALVDNTTTDVEYVVKGFARSPGSPNPGYTEQTWYMADEPGAYGEFVALQCQPDTLVAENDYMLVRGRITKYVKNSKATIEISKGIGTHYKRLYTFANPIQGGNVSYVAFKPNDTVIIVASPAYGYHFIQWNDGVTTNPRTFILTQDTTFTAEFAANPRISYIYDSSIGSVSGPYMTETGHAADSISFVATPNYGYHFVQWNDGNKDNPRTIWLSQDTTFTAEFAISRTGTCGDNNLLTWTYNPEKKVLTISGNGTLNTNCRYGLEALANMHTLEIQAGVTSVGQAAFKNGNRLETVILGADIETISDSAFANCPYILSVYAHMEYPPVISASVFVGDGDLSIVDLFVPESALTRYRKTAVWKEFNLQAGQEPEPQPEDIYTITYIGKDDITLDSENVTLHLPEAPEIEGFTFQKWVFVTGDVINGLTVQAIYEANAPTSAPAVYTNPANPAQKLIRNGNVYILTGDKTYTLTGQEVK